MIYPVGKYDTPRFISTVTPDGFAVVDTKLKAANGGCTTIIGLHANGRVNTALVAASNTHRLNAFHR